MSDLPTLEARVREAREKVLDGFGCPSPQDSDGNDTWCGGCSNAVRELIAAAEALGAARERARCREAATLCCHVVAVPLAAIDALEVP